MYSKESYEVIKKRILDNIGIDVDKREGSFINDMISPLALELTKTYMEFSNILNIAFIETSYEGYLDRKVNEFGVYRKLGEKAKGIIKITGTNDTVIPSGTIAKANELTFILEEGIIIDGEALIIATAEEVGKKYNILANTITKLDMDLYGVNAAINESDFTGGIDRETDEELKSRFLATIQKPITSGNIYHYEQWALEVNGVGNAIVKSLWNGPGTVKVMISDSNKQPVSEEIIEACEKYINDVRPIGATVTITTPSLFNVEISVSITLDNSKTLDEVKTILNDNLIQYSKSCSNEIIFTKVGGVISNTKGIADYSNLKINNQSANVTIPSEHIINSSLVVR